MRHNVYNEVRTIDLYYARQPAKNYAYRYMTYSKILHWGFINRKKILRVETKGMTIVTFSKGFVGAKM